MKNTVLLTFGLAFIVSGCSTPKEVLQYANNGVLLTQTRRAEMAAFERQEVESEKLVANSLLVINKTNTIANSVISRPSIIGAGLGDTVTIGLARRMTVAVDDLGKLAESTASEMTSAEVRFSTLLSPLPSTAAAETAFQEKLAVFGRELSDKQRLSEFADYLKTVQKNVADGKKAAEAAPTGK